MSKTPGHIPKSALGITERFILQNTHDVGDKD